MIKPIHHIIRLQAPDTPIAICLGKPAWSDMLNFYGFSQEEIDDYLTSNAVCGFTGSSIIPLYIALPKEYNPILTAHECLHAAIAIWSHAGANIALPDNDEVLTYTMDALHRMIKDIYDAN